MALFTNATSDRLEAIRGERTVPSVHAGFMISNLSTAANILVIKDIWH